MSYFPKSKYKPLFKSKEKPWGNNQEFYKTYHWQKVRELQLNKEPLCRECAKKGKTTLATVVDHIRPIEQGGAMLDWDNLQSLCESCHNRKSGKEKRGKGGIIGG